ncbi:GvpL/GvpF family gas vesicle protein [Streptomyces sp. NBC_01618]|uniref:GvpL/GvpF family gas vesicle protein n=1 Tax=Streptomyces sp. NBC_01618 TaxID=2975900 RepID=UPI003866FBED|nr:GvpL/GvpF family gas vesicle protein [Streptomyces sp. NBC_01618]
MGTPPAPLWTVRHGQVAAVVSEAPQKLRAWRRDVLAHRDFLLRLSDEGPVLPMQFGMVAPDEETVRGQLVVSEMGHVAALDYLSDAVTSLSTAATATTSEAWRSDLPTRTANTSSGTHVRAAGV